MPKIKKIAKERDRDATLVMFLALNMILLAFFILLVALSAPDKSKEAELAIELRKAFQSFGGSFLGLGSSLDEQGVSKEENPLSNSEQVEKHLGEVSRFIEENKETKTISYEVSSEGFAIHMTEDFLFQEGSAKLRNQARPFFNKVYDLIMRTTNKVRIEGHTDNQEIRSSQAKDSWELSALRAVSVFRFFTQGGEMNDGRIALVGHGSKKPITSNLTEGGRAKNNRVTIKFTGRIRTADQ